MSNLGVLGHEVKEGIGVDMEVIEESLWAGK